MRRRLRRRFQDLRACPRVRLLRRPAGRRIANGASLGDVGGLVWSELGIAAAHAATAYVVFRVLERESRRSAALDSL
jgi:hypothetical protein